jgi:hypothetical protein
VGLAALGAGAALTYWGRRDNDLLARCAPYCSPASIDHIRQLYLASDIAIGTGVAAIGIAGVIFLDVRPAPSGAIASVAGTF